MEDLPAKLNAEPYWFHRIDLGNGIETPGWCDPARDRLPYFGLPESMSGLRVLDMGCAEGFFTFEALRRGAAEVVSLDFDPQIVQRFAICAEALGLPNRAQVMSVYDVDASDLGTFDLVMCFGLLYHLADPVLALRKIAAVSTGTLLLQSWSMKVNGRLRDVPLARFYPAGVMSGPAGTILDDTVFWQPNAAGVRALLEHVGFVDIEILPGAPTPRLSLLRARLRRQSTKVAHATTTQVRARVAEPRPGRPPQADQLRHTD